MRIIVENNKGALDKGEMERVIILFNEKEMIL